MGPGHVTGKLRARLPATARDWILLLTGAVLALASVGVGLLVRPDKLPLGPQADTIVAAWVPATVKHYEATTSEMAKKYNIDPTAIAILMTMESGGYSKAESEAGAKGLMQITPATASDIAKRYLKQPVTTFDLNDPRTSIEFGAAYMAMLRDEFGEQNQSPSWNYTMELVAAAYNGGPGTAGKLYRGEGIADTQTVIYSRDALNMWRERHAKTSPTYDRWLERGGSRLIDLAKTE